MGSPSGFGGRGDQPVERDSGRSRGEPEFWVASSGSRHGAPARGDGTRAGAGRRLSANRRTVALTGWSGRLRVSGIPAVMDGGPAGLQGIEPATGARSTRSISTVVIPVAPCVRLIRTDRLSRR